MAEINIKKEWNDYCQSEIDSLKPILQDLGFELDETQVHIGGERYIFSEKKLVLVGKRLKDNLPVIIKVSSDAKGISEIKHERQCRIMLDKIKFAYHVFFSPPEILYQEKDSRVIFITKYIEQDCQFLERPLKDQFFLGLKGLEVQEGVQVTTYEHAHDIGKYFGVWEAKDYLQKFDEYYKDVTVKLADQRTILDLYKKAKEFLMSNVQVIDLYTGFLTHWDFVPHNIRVQGNDIYLLDHSSIRFGNKHESWARFVNFMVLHNPDLAEALLFYVQKNRPASENISLRAMRAYRLTEIIWHHANILSRADGDLKILSQERINLWSQVLASILDGKILNPAVIEDYKKMRDSLRSPEEKKRQEKLH